MRKKFGRWAGAAGLIAVAVLLLTTDGGLPLLPGRPPTTSDSSPSDFSGAPTGHPSFQVFANLETYDLSSQAFPDVATTGSDIPPLDEFSVPRGDDSERGSELDWPPNVLQGTLASVLLALMVLRASLGRNREQRPTAASPAAIAA